MNYKKLTVRLDAEQYAHLCWLSETSGLKFEPMIRQLIMGATLRPRPPDTYAALLRELSAIGNNINQIAHQANTRGEATRQEVEDAVRLIRRAWRLVKDSF